MPPTPTSGPPLPPPPEDDLDDSRFRAAIARIMADARQQATPPPAADPKAHPDPGGPAG